MKEVATLLWAGLYKHDKQLTPTKVVQLIDEYASITWAMGLIQEFIGLGQEFMELDTDNAKDNSEGNQ